MENTSWLLPSTPCWLDLQESDLTKEAYLLAKIANYEDSQDKVTIFMDLQKKEKKEVPLSLISQTNENLKENGEEDMVDMACLNEAEILSNIRRRYEKNLIFTYIGPTLLVVNPYKSLKGEFDDEKRLIYENLVIIFFLKKFLIEIR